jgi:hypothetical protein
VGKISRKTYMGRPRMEYIGPIMKDVYKKALKYGSEAWTITAEEQKKLEEIEIHGVIEK